jgi:methionyl-tRNA synthetase
MADDTLQTTAKPQISFADFTKLDLRVATITGAEPHPNADKLIKIQLDDGSGSPRQVCAGIKAWYEPRDLVGRQVVIVVNLEPRKLRGEMSQGMVLAATTGPSGQEADVVLLAPDRPVPAGAPVT